MRITKEYSSRREYERDNPHGKLDGSDGHGLLSDRLHNTAVWNAANLTNLNQNRYGDYVTIAQRAAFYGWFAAKIDARGFDNLWPGAAYIVASQMSRIERVPGLDYYVGEDVVKFANAGNKAIFDDVFEKLQELYNGPVMKGLEAKKWDESTLQNEQFNVVQPIYKQQSAKTLSMLDNMAKGRGVFAIGLAEELRFNGNLSNPQDRYKHGMDAVTNYFKLQRVYWKIKW